MIPIRIEEGPYGLAAIDTYSRDIYRKPFYVDCDDAKANPSWIEKGYPLWIGVRDQGGVLMGDAVCKKGERKQAEQFLLDLCSAAVP